MDGLPVQQVFRERLTLKRLAESLYLSSEPLPPLFIHGRKMGNYLPLFSFSTGSSLTSFPPSQQDCSQYPHILLSPLYPTPSAASPLQPSLQALPSSPNAPFSGASPASSSQDHSSLPPVFPTPNPFLLAWFSLKISPSGR